MAHCPLELLGDLMEVLGELRRWPGVIEKKPAVFYLRSQPFLHFHLLEGGIRRADIKGLADWSQLDMTGPLSASAKRSFLRALQQHYAERTRKGGRLGDAKSLT